MDLVVRWEARWACDMNCRTNAKLQLNKVLFCPKEPSNWANLCSMQGPRLGAMQLSSLRYVAQYNRPAATKRGAVRVRANGDREGTLHTIAVLLVICIGSSLRSAATTIHCDNRVCRVFVHEGAQATRHRKHKFTRQHRRNHKTAGYGYPAGLSTGVLSLCMDHHDTPQQKLPVLQRHRLQQTHLEERMISLPRAAASTAKDWRYAVPHSSSKGVSHQHNEGLDPTGNGAHPSWRWIFLGVWTIYCAHQSGIFSHLLGTRTAQPGVCFHGAGRRCLETALYMEATLYRRHRHMLTHMTCSTSQL